MQQAAKFSVFEKQQIGLAKGDKIRITANGFSNEKTRLNNGNILSVKGFNKDGNIVALRGKKEIVLDKNYRNFTHGYYTTSPASQGKSVNKVIIIQSSASGKASSREQFYVSATRGKFGIKIFTDDKEFMMKSIQRSSSGKTATELAESSQAKNLSQKERFNRKTNIYRTTASKVKDTWHKTKEKVANINQKIKQDVQPKAPIRAK